MKIFIVSRCVQYICNCCIFFFLLTVISVAELHHFYATLSKNWDATSVSVATAPAPAPAPSILQYVQYIITKYCKSTILKVTKANNTSVAIIF
jgi:hypothetical protein